LKVLALDVTFRNSIKLVKEFRLELVQVGEDVLVKGLDQSHLAFPAVAIKWSSSLFRLQGRKITGDDLRVEFTARTQIESMRAFGKRGSFILEWASIGMFLLAL
jgi:hypothetical protein